MKYQDSEVTVLCDFADDIPVSDAELKLLEDLLPEIVKDMSFMQTDKE